MKKSVLLIVGLVLLLGSCDLFNPVSLAPPDWIIGTWSTNTGTTSADMLFTFTSSNCVMTSSTASIDFYEAYKKSSLSDNASDTSYTISLSESGTTASYSFTKASTTTFTYRNTVNGLTVGPLTFYKQ